ncbi:hypothetical protein CSKR_110852, partial [Clonorchis sinensis]
SNFSRDANRIYEKIYYSHASSVVSTVTPVVRIAEYVNEVGNNYEARGFLPPKLTLIEYAPIQCTNVTRRGCMVPVTWSIV